MPCPQTVATQLNEQLGLLDIGRAINGLVVCNNWDLEPLGLLNGLGLYQLPTEVLIVLRLISVYFFVYSNSNTPYDEIFFVLKLYYTFLLAFI